MITNIIARIVWFNPIKGYGYCEDENQNLYFLYGQELGGNIWGLGLSKIPQIDDILTIQSWEFQTLFSKPNIARVTKCKLN